MWLIYGQRFIEHLTSDSRPSLSINKGSLMSHVLLDSVRILLRLCVMFNEECTVAHGGHFNIFFLLSYRVIYFTLSEKVRARDKVFFD